jgi:ribosomal-protein-alanine N-acetyltransferase
MSVMAGAGLDPEAIRLRPLAFRDLDRVMELEADLFPFSPWSREMYEAELGAPDRCYVAAVAPDGQVVGYAGIGLGADAEIMTVGVAGPWRRRGVGARLVESLLEAARDARARRVFLEVRADDEGAQRLYRRAGFRSVGLRRGYYQPEGRDAVVMRLDLRGAAAVGAEATRGTGEER